LHFYSSVFNELVAIAARTIISAINLTADRWWCIRHLLVKLP